MLSVNLIERIFAARRFDPLLDAIAANGLALPLALRVRLAQSPVAAVALGLKRVAELTYRPTVLSRDMADFILDQRRADGSFGERGAFGGDPLLTAVVAAALGAMVDASPDNKPALDQARRDALGALGMMQADDGLFTCRADRTDETRALSGAFILYLLGRDDAFRQAVRLFDLLDWFDQHDDQLDADTARLCRMGRAEMPVADPAMAA